MVSPSHVLSLLPAVASQLYIRSASCYIAVADLCYDMFLMVVVAEFGRCATLSLAEYTVEV